jgi:hypothetical protein
MATDNSIPAPGVFQLPLTGMRGKKRVIVGFAQVADDDFTHTYLRRFSWRLDAYGYPVRNAPREPGRPRKNVWLHQEVFRHYHGPVPAGLQIDHINRDKCDNRPDNLRAVTLRVQGANRKPGRRNKTGYVGVTYTARNLSKRWQARIGGNKDPIRLGYYRTAREAADAVNRAYQKYFPDVQVPNP